MVSREHRELCRNSGSGRTESCSCHAKNICEGVMKNSLLVLIAICGGCFVTGCGAGNTITTPPPVPATHFSVTPATATPTAGTAFMITVSALGASGQTATSYSGTLHFSSTDALAVLPADTPVASVSGTFSVTLNTAGSQTVSVSDAGAL